MEHAAADTFRIVVTNLPPAESPWIKIGLPVVLTVIAVLGALWASHRGAVIGGRESRKATEAAQRGHFMEEDRRRLLRATKRVRRSLEEVSAISEALRQSDPDQEIAPTLLKQLRTMVATFNGVADDLVLLPDEQLQDAMHAFFENVDINLYLFDRTESRFSSHLAQVAADPTPDRNSVAVERLQRRNMRQEYIKEIAGWKRQADALLIRLHRQAGEKTTGLQEEE